MIEKRKFVAAFVLLVLVTSTVTGQSDYTGMELAADLTAAIKIMDGDRDALADNQLPVRGGSYVRGAVDTISVYEMEGCPLICIPEEVTMGQAMRVIMKYIKDHPEQLHAHAAVITIVALKGAFPCTVSKSSP